MSQTPNSPLVEELLKIVEAPKKVNMQEYKNNPGAQATQEEYNQSTNRLFGDKAPNLVIKSERPEHRLIVYLKAQGLTNQEIADKTGYGYQWVCQIVRQPWFRQRFVEECQAVGRDAVSTFLEGEVLPSLEKLREIRDTAVKPADQRAAADSLLDRFLGKPVARVEREDTTKGLDDARATAEELERQVKALRAQNGLADSLSPQS